MPPRSMPQVILLHTTKELRQTMAASRQGGTRIGLVPTMGALHKGHLSLVRASQSDCGLTVVTLYVNPSQFGPDEDFARYPRTLQSDLDALSTCVGPILVFAPFNEDVYPPGYQTWVEVDSVAQPLEGQCRPGHFRGVATIVLKLFNMVGPDIAYFGQKDYQQAAVIRRMVMDLNVPITIRVCPTVREADGLAMSSRNAYLAPDARQHASVLYQSLCMAEELVRGGEDSASRIVAKMRQVIERAPDTSIDYIALVDPQTFEAVDRIVAPTLVALAVHLGTTRLIDNCILEPPKSGG